MLRRSLLHLDGGSAQGQALRNGHGVGEGYGIRGTLGGADIDRVAEGVGTLIPCAGLFRTDVVGLGGILRVKDIAGNGDGFRPGANCEPIPAEALRRELPRESDKATHRLIDLNLAVHVILVKNQIDSVDPVRFRKVVFASRITRNVKQRPVSFQQVRRKLNPGGICIGINPPWFNSLRSVSGSGEFTVHTDRCGESIRCRVIAGVMSGNRCQALNADRISRQQHHAPVCPGRGTHQGHIGTSLRPQLAQILQEGLLVINAGFAVDVLRLFADEDIAFLAVAVLRDVLLAADQLRLKVGRIAFLRMGVALGLRLAAEQDRLLLIAAVGMRVPRGLCQSAGQHPIGIARVGMGMGLRFLLAAHQHGLDAAALRGMGVGLCRLLAADGRGLGIAGRGMVVHRPLLQRADQRLPIVAFIAMGVGENLLQSAGELVALRAVGMLLLAADIALGFQGDGRQNQGIGGAEYHHAGNAGDDGAPYSIPFSAGSVFADVMQITHWESSPSKNQLFHRAEIGEGPDTIEYAAHNLFFKHAAHGAAAAVHGGGAVVAHDEHPAIRNLVGQLDVTLAKGLLVHIGFVQQLAVDIHIALLVQVNPLAFEGNDTLDEDFVIIIETDDVPPVEGHFLNRDNDVPLEQGRRHGGAIDAEHRQQQRGHQNRNRRHRKQDIHRAANHTAVPLAIAHPLQFRPEAFQPGVLNFLLHGLPS